MRGGRPPFLVEDRYPYISVYGLTLNYASPSPWDLVVTFEGGYTPGQPYYDATPTLSADYRRRPTWSQAIKFQRSTFILPHPTSAMSIQWQVNSTVLFGNPRWVKSTPAPLSADNKIDKNITTTSIVLTQPLFHNNLELSMKFIWDFAGDFMLNPGIKYRLGDHWYFDLFGISLSGSDRRAGKFAAMKWGDEVCGRITFQF